MTCHHFWVSCYFAQTYANLCKNLILSETEYDYGHFMQALSKILGLVGGLVIKQIIQINIITLKGLRHEDFPSLGQFCAKIIT